MQQSTKQRVVDALIIGSGPVGATFAHIISEQLPDANVLMIDVGPRLSERAGKHVKNFNDPKDREWAQVQSQGPEKHPYPVPTMAERAKAARAGHLSADLLARPGIHLVTPNEEDLKKNEMPAAALSSNVGGMGVHWTCACPRLGNEERITFIPETEMDSLFAEAEKLLCVTQRAFPDTPEGLAILRILGETFNKVLPPSRQVQKMPLACKVNEMGERYWVGPDVILGKLAEPDYQGNFELRSETLCRQLFTKDGQVTGALVEHLPTGKQEVIQAKVVIVAADALRTPQLLWASGIRPSALGHYLNEHPFIFCFVELNEKLIDRATATAYDPAKRTEPTIGVFWVPFEAPGHPFHGQVMHMDASPIQIETEADPKHIVGLGWGFLKEISYDDHIEFSENETDYLGMPKMNLKFSLTGKDKKEMEQAMKEQAKAAAAFGKQVKEGEQTLLPAGTSLHTQGTIRMGEVNDGNSVCDSYSKVWGFDNLFVGGNGVIPTATTSNPTLTSVALAIRGCEKVVALLKA